MFTCIFICINRLNLNFSKIIWENIISTVIHRVNHYFLNQKCGHGEKSKRIMPKTSYHKLSTVCDTSCRVLSLPRQSTQPFHTSDNRRIHPIWACLDSPREHLEPRSNVKHYCKKIKIINGKNQRYSCK